MSKINNQPKTVSSEQVNAPAKTMNTIVIPLITSARDEMILEQKLEARGKLKNATLGSLLKRIKQMKRDKRWRSNMLIQDEDERKKAYRVLHDDYKVSQYHTRDIAFKHWQASKWLPEHFGGAVANSLGDEVWADVSKWLYKKGTGEQGQPRFKPSRDNLVLTGSGNKQNLYLKISKKQSKTQNKKDPLGAKSQQGELQESQEQTTIQVSHLLNKKKKLSLLLAPNWQPGSKNWSKHVDGRTVKQVALKQETVRGKTRYFAHILITGLPYRNPAYLELAQQQLGKTVGLDVGPSNIAAVGQETSKLVGLYPKEKQDSRKREQKKRRRTKRALDRSSRSTNPETYDEKGRSIKGKKRTNKSKAYKRKQAKIKDLERKRVIHRKQDQTGAARVIMSQMGTNISSEKNSYKAWQASFYGKRMLETAPAALMNQIHAEAQLITLLLTGNEKLSEAASFEFSTSSNCAPSQHCLCGSKQKKPLQQRYHSCEACGLGVESSVQRDLLSALLARLISENKTTNDYNILSNGPYSMIMDDKDGNKTLVLELLSSKTTVLAPLNWSGTRLLTKAEDAGVSGTKSLSKESKDSMLDDSRLAPDCLASETPVLTRSSHSLPTQPESLGMERTSTRTKANQIEPDANKNVSGTSSYAFQSQSSHPGSIPINQAASRRKSHSR